MHIALGEACLVGMFSKAVNLAPGAAPLDNMLTGINIGDPTTVPPTQKAGLSF